jgi:acyl-CoA thioesterase I
MKRIRLDRLLPLLVILFLSCGRADDVGSGAPGSTGEVGASDSSGPTRSTDGEGSRTASPPEATLPRVVFLGTSLTAGYGLADETRRFTDVIQRMADSAGIRVRVVNAGVNGDTSAGGLRRVDRALEGGADVLVVELGANDGLRGLDVPALRANLTAVIDRAREISPGIEIVLAGMEAPPNMGLRYTGEFREAYRAVASEEHVPLIPFLLDGVAGVPELNQGDRIHPNVEGHARIAHEVLWPELEPILREVARR